MERLIDIGGAKICFDALVETGLITRKQLIQLSILPGNDGKLQKLLILTEQATPIQIEDARDLQAIETSKAVRGQDISIEDLGKELGLDGEEENDAPPTTEEVAAVRAHDVKYYAMPEYKSPVVRIGIDSVYGYGPCGYLEFHRQDGENDQTFTERITQTVKNDLLKELADKEARKQFERINSPTRSSIQHLKDFLRPPVLPMELPKVDFDEFKADCDPKAFENSRSGTLPNGDLSGNPEEFFATRDVSEVLDEFFNKEPGKGNGIVLAEDDETGIPEMPYEQPPGVIEEHPQPLI